MGAPSKPLQLFGFWRSLATYRVRIGLRLKGFDWTEEMVDLLKGEQYEESLGARNPQQRLPVLMLDDARSLAQSLAILEYLDEVHPAPALWPEDRYQRALARQFALISIADCHPLIVPRVRGYLAETFGADDAAIEAWGAALDGPGPACDGGASGQARATAKRVLLWRGAGHCRHRPGLALRRRRVF